MTQPGKVSGFTLIELLVTVVIVGLLASISMPIYELTMQRSRERDLREALREMRAALDAYKQAAEMGRINADKFSSGYPPNLRTLVDGVIDLRSPLKDQRIYFLRRIPADPFADPGLKTEQMWGTRAYSSPPDAPMEGADVFDVFSQSNLVGLNGIPYRQW